MTEHEWLTSSDPVKMLECLKGGYRHQVTGVLSGRVVNDPCRVSPRQLRLFACACCRAVWDSLVDPLSRRAVELAELYADGLAAEEKLRIGLRLAFNAWGFRSHGFCAAYAPWAACASNIATETGEEFVGAVEVAGLVGSAQAAILRDIVGNPFRPTSLCGVTEGITRTELVRECPNCAAILVWGSGTVPRMAQAIYDERAFERLPVLADALEEAGCDNVDIIEHLRGSGPHVRGCWVLDLLLGKE